MKNSWKCLSALLALTMALTLTTAFAAAADTAAPVAAAPAEPYTDVAESDWYYSGVVYVYTNGLLGGKTADTFVPGGTVTRGEAAAVLYALAGGDSQNKNPGACPFTDVSADAAKAVAWANAKGIVSGYTRTEFRPDAAVSRQQLAVWLYNYANAFHDDTTAGGMAIREYGDYDQIAPYALSALGWTNAAGLISGRMTLKKACRGSQPRSSAASYSRTSIWRNFGPTLKIT